MDCPASANWCRRVATVALQEDGIALIRKWHRIDTKMASTAAMEKRSVWRGGEIISLQLQSGDFA
jgi:hypothetical protein